MITKDIENVLKKVQISKACHQKNLKILENIYNQVQHHEFMKALFQFLQSIFIVQNEFSERTLDFLAQFVTHMTSADDSDADLFEEDLSVHPFLTDIVTETLKYHNLASECLRFNSCLFVRLILHHIGTKVQLDNTICDLIQDAMLDRTMDPKSSIRHQAVMALVRLQDPQNPDCPVMNALLSLMVDGNPLIRAETVKIIAPYNVTIPHILKRLQDVDANVRIMALRRCADIGPKSFKIVERQHVLKCGLGEDNKKVKKVFTDNLLVKWLNAYNQNVVEFLKALKLDADESDVIATETISKDILNLILSFIPIQDIIEVLPVKEDTIIPVQNWTSECVILWNVTIKYLKDIDEEEEYLGKILPELTTLCSYIEGFITYKKQLVVEEWQYLEYQQTLYSLIEIIECHDFSDEVGRKKVMEILINLIKDETLQFRLLKKIIGLVDNLKSKIDDFITEICVIISEIREPLVEKTSSQNENPTMDYDIARLKVKLNMLESQLEDATAEKDFLKAHSVEQEILKIKEELQKLLTPIVEVVKVTKDDPKTLCRCLDILIALLQLPSVQTLTPSLVAVKDEFVMPLLDYNAAEVHWRALNCLSLFCVIDKALAKEYVKVLSIPIITYRAITNYNKFALMTSIKAVSDLFRINGIKIFGGETSSRCDESRNTTNNMNTTKRRLYRNDEEDSSLSDLSRFHFESVIEIMLDMLDDENSEIRECAVIAIEKLIRSNFPVTPPIMTRMILKWYNPLTSKASDNLQQILGRTIGNYANNHKGAQEVLSKTVIPIIIGIVSAPKTSPLADVDIENLLKFLAILTNSGKDVVNPHLTLAHMICHEILKKKNSAAVSYLTKMLLQLEFFTDNISSLKELSQQVQIILDEVVDLDKTSNKNLRKLCEKLEIAISDANNSASANEIEIDGTNIQVNGMVTASEENSATNSVEMTNVEVNEMVTASEENSATNSVEINQTSATTQNNTDKNIKKRKRKKRHNNLETVPEETNESLDGVILDQNGDDRTDSSDTEHISDSESDNVTETDREYIKDKNKKRKVNNKDQNIPYQQSSEEEVVVHNSPSRSKKTQRETRYNNNQAKLCVILKRQINKDKQVFLNNENDKSISQSQSNSENSIPSYIENQNGDDRTDSSDTEHISDSEWDNVTETDREYIKDKNKKRKVNNKNQNIPYQQSCEEEVVVHNSPSRRKKTQRETRYNNNQAKLCVILKRQINKDKQVFLNNENDKSISQSQSNSENSIPSYIEMNTCVASSTRLDETKDQNGKGMDKIIERRQSSETENISDSESDKNMTKTDKAYIKDKSKKRRLNNKNQNIPSQKSSEEEIVYSSPRTRSKNIQAKDNITKDKQVLLKNQKQKSTSESQSSTESSISSTIESRLEDKDTTRSSVRLHNKDIGKNNGLHSLAETGRSREIIQTSGKTCSSKKTFSNRRSSSSSIENSSRNSVPALRVLRKRKSTMTSRSFSESEHDSYGRRKKNKM